MSEAKVGRQRMPAGPESKAMADTIRGLRAAARLTQVDLAEKAGMNRFAIMSVESGEQQIRLEQIVKIARVFGLTAGELTARAGL